MRAHSGFLFSQFSQEWDWNVHAKSVTRNPVFRTVDAVVAWNPKPNRQGEYMVTWEVNKENFGVKGHVYTRNSSVTLNLNPEEVYRVQVRTTSSFERTMMERSRVQRKFNHLKYFSGWVHLEGETNVGGESCDSRRYAQHHVAHVLAAWNVNAGQYTFLPQQGEKP